MDTHSTNTEGATPAFEQDLAINTVNTYNSLSSSHTQTLSGEPEENQQCSSSNAAYLDENEMLASNSSSIVQQENDADLAALRSSETHADRRRQRLAAHAKRAASERASETDHERRLRLAALAKRARLKRSVESEEEKSVRLTKDAEKTRARRSSVLKERTRITKSDKIEQNSQESSVQHDRGEGYVHSQFPSTSRAYGSEALDSQQLPLSHYSEATTAVASIDTQLMSDPNGQNRGNSNDEKPRISEVLISGTQEYHGESEQLTASDLLSNTDQSGCRLEETDHEHQSRLAIDARRMASRRSNETEDERKHRLASLVERARLKRLLENEQERSKRLANDAKRARTRRMVEVERRSDASSVARMIQDPLESDQTVFYLEIILLGQPYFLS
ncbi:unnamed protein product [Cylicocyclus nassatus]|uniref:Uncharacterized protein n=1 Tax=Cylicocyclus nassatus TaxID=53992 RepID=A0AA36GS88_CYLNA|nr:unnamed protein product [Cylicocyclus nassatus]